MTITSPMRLRTRALAVVAAVLATALLWIAGRVFGVELWVDPRNSQPPGAISLPFAAAMALAVSLLGWGARAALDRMTSQAPVIWTALAVVVLLVSFLPLFVVAATGATKAILALMHVAVAAALIPVLSRKR